MLHPQVPLHGVRVFEIWVHEPLDLIEWGRRWEQIRAEWSGSRNGGLGVGRRRIIKIFGQLLANVWPGTFVVLSRLGDCGPVVEENSNRGSHRGVRGKPLG